MLGLACAALLIGLAFPQPPAYGAPAQVNASFSFQPSSPLTNEVVTFTSTSTSAKADDPIVSWEWDFNAGPVFHADASGPTVVRAFQEIGQHRVVLRATSRRAVGTASANVAVRNRQPVAAFAYAPASPDTGQLVSFTSTSSDPEGDPLTLAWDLDSDGRFNDGGARNVSRRFASPGTYSIRLRATDSHGATAEAIRPVVVGNRAPTASFVTTPAEPLTGATVSFISVSSDPDGPVDGHAWDLDGDGQFDDATGSIASRAFTRPGAYTVSLRVSDSQGLTGIAFQTVVVNSSSLTGRLSGLRLLSPFPVIRVVGTVRSDGVKLRRLVVTAPAGSRVLVSCRGRRCPFRRQARTAGRRQAISARSLRIRRLERRLLRPGIVIRIYVTKSGTIGKYTRFRIRRALPPMRSDRCLIPGSSRPRRCPS